MICFLQSLRTFALFSKLSRGISRDFRLPFCYIMTVDKDFGFVPGDPVCFDKLYVVISKQGVAVRRGTPVEQVCNRKETMWYENHAVSPVRIEGRSRDTQPIRSVRSSLTIRLARGCKHWHPRSRKKIWGKKKSPLSVYVSPSISQTYNKLRAPFENKMREREIFYKEVCFVRSLKFVHYLWLCSWLGLW